MHDLIHINEECAGLLRFIAIEAVLVPHSGKTYLTSSGINCSTAELPPSPYQVRDRARKTYSGSKVQNLQYFAHPLWLEHSDDVVYRIP